MDRELDRRRWETKKGKKRIEKKSNMMEQIIGEEKRMRRGSTGDVEELLKRKREKMERKRDGVGGGNL